MDDTEIAIIGGGIVGIAAAYQLVQRLKTVRLVVLEKEPRLAMHQTGRNSGVMHSGVYYRPESHKAAFCRKGKAMLEAFCAEHSIPHERCGKLIVATLPAEEKRLAALYERGQKNGVACEWWGSTQMKEREPHLAGIRAIHVPEAGIVDYRAVVAEMANQIRDAGGSIALETRVDGGVIDDGGVTLRTSRGPLRARHVVNCAGLFSDRVSRRFGHRPTQRIIPFRGEYYELRPPARHLCKHLIYPVPDPNLPFLGVHFTRMIGGRVECGPNAVPALRREGYRWRDISPRDLWEMATFPGTWRMAARWWRTGLEEIWRSISKSAFLGALQRLIPDLQESDLSVAPAGVRAQAVDRSGNLLDDFVILRDERVLHVLNAPSPAATASLAIGDEIARAVHRA